MRAEALRLRRAPFLFLLRELWVAVFEKGPHVEDIDCVVLNYGVFMPVKDTGVFQSRAQT